MNLHAHNQNTNKQDAIHFWYGLVLRPFGIACQPKGESTFVSREMCGTLFPNIENNNRAIRHGVISYRRKLSEKEIEQYDLQPLCAKSGGLISTERQLSESLAFDCVIAKLISIIKEGINTETNSDIILALGDGYNLNDAFEKFEVCERRSEFPLLFAEFNEIREYINADVLIEEIKCEF